MISRVYIGNIGDWQPTGKPPHNVDDTKLVPGSIDTLLRTVPDPSGLFGRFDMLDRFDSGIWYACKSDTGGYTFPKLREPDPNDQTLSTYTPASAYIPDPSHTAITTKTIGFDATNNLVGQLIIGSVPHSIRRSDGSFHTDERPDDVLEHYQSADAAMTFQAQSPSNLINSLQSLYNQIIADYPQVTTSNERFAAQIGVFGRWPDGRATVWLSMQYSQDRSGGPGTIHRNYSLNTTDSGISWSTTDYGTTFGWMIFQNNWEHIHEDQAIVPLEERTVATGSAQIAISTSDGGSTWANLSGAAIDPVQPVNSPRILQLNVFAIIATGGINFTEDAGATWTFAAYPPGAFDFPRATSIYRLNDTTLAAVFSSTSLLGQNYRYLRYTPQTDPETPLADRLSWTGITITSQKQFMSDPHNEDQLPSWLHGISPDKEAEE